MTRGLEERLGYTFKKPQLLSNALTHASLAGEKQVESNERLEFLGDAVLELCVSEYLYKHFKHLNEGQLTRYRAQLVQEASLAQCAEALSLGELIMMSKGEEQLGGRSKPAILSDAMEAVLGAVYLDGGLEAAGAVCKRLLNPDKPPVALSTDYKSALQELLQRRSTETPAYRLLREDGPPHARTFHVEVWHAGRALAQGAGGTKKAAEQEAARRAMEQGVSYAED